MPKASLTIDGTEVITKENGLTSIDIGTIVSQSGFIQTYREGTLGQGGKVFLFKDISNVSWIVHEFREDGIFWLPSTKNCDVFMIGGGGSGGGSFGDQDTGKGGGGAGGALWRQNYSISNGEYEIIVGKGGLGTSQGHATASAAKITSNNGEHTYAFNVIAKGGGHGGHSDGHCYSQPGGCGGGGGARNTSSLGYNGAASNQQSFTDWTSYGNSGGNSSSTVSNYSGGGGGGIGSAGGSQTGGESDSNSQGGSGGAGLDFSSYFGKQVGHFGWFGGGGGGGTYRHSTNTMYQAPPNNGGYGGGGYGNSAREGSQTEPNVFSSDKIHGINGTGGGGGGSSESHENNFVEGQQNGRGGSGVVIIRYQL